MGSMNRQKMIVGGLVAGVVLAVLDYVVGTYVLGPWASGAPGSMVAVLALTMNSKRAAVGGCVIDVLLGVSIVWAYAAIRPRYGAGPKTAMCAGFFVWFVATLAYSSYYSFRLASLQFMAVVSIAALVEMLIAAYVGCQMYSESSSA